MIKWETISFVAIFLVIYGIIKFVFAWIGINIDSGILLGILIIICTVLILNKIESLKPKDIPPEGEENDP